MPFGTACCAIEFMALSASHYDIARFGAEVLRFSPRQADLHVRGRHHPRQARPGPEDDLRPDARAQVGDLDGRLRVLRAASTARYHVMQGIDEIIPVDVYVPGLPALPRGPARGRDEDPGADQEAASRRRSPQGAHRVGAPGAGAPSTAAPGATPGRRTTPPRRDEGEAPARRPRAAGCCRTTARKSTMASATAAGAPPRSSPSPPPASSPRRSATPSCARSRLPGRPRDHRGPQGLGRGRARSCATTPSSTTSSSSTCAASTTSTGRTTDRALRGRAAPLLGLARSTTSA